MSTIEIAMQQLADTQDVARHGRDAACALLELAELQNTPARLQTLELTQTTPIVHDEVRTASKSIGVLNPTGFTLRLGLAGGSAGPTARGVPVPPYAVLVLPIATEDLEIGLDDPAAVGGDTVVFYLLRYATVQPLLMHRYG